MLKLCLHILYCKKIVIVNLNFEKDIDPGRKNKTFCILTQKLNVKQKYRPSAYMVNYKHDQPQGFPQQITLWGILYSASQ